jgi:hypothetical protein
MKKVKRKKDPPRKATVIDAYIGERMRERRQVLKKWGKQTSRRPWAFQSSKFRSKKPATTGSARRGCSAFAALF